MKIKKVRKLNDKELTKIIEVFDACIECWKTSNPEKCKYQSIREKIGLKSCKMVRIWNDTNKKIAKGIYKIK